MKTNSTNLTVSKGVVDRVRKLLGGKKKIDLSITQFVEHILTEACSAIECETPVDQLDTIIWIRKKLGKEGTRNLLHRLEAVEKLIQAQPKKLSAA